MKETTFDGMTRQEIKTMWLEALRSGKYRQAQGRLQRQTENGIGFCCLGVLCDLEVKRTPSSFWEQTQSTSEIVYSFKTDPSDYGISGFLDYATIKRLDMTELFQNKVADMNDAGASFADIADVIESEWNPEEI